MIHSRSILFLVISVISFWLLLFATACAPAPEGHVVIRLGHGLDTTHPVHKAMMHLAERLAEKSGGSMELKVYSSGQLGSERECLELLQVGGLGMTKISTAVLESFDPVFQVFGLPYLFRDEAHKHAVLDGPIGRELLATPTDKLMRGLCFYDAGSRSFYAKKPIREPSDLEGLKIRVQESPAAFALIRAFQASPTPISWGELYTALQQGIVDGAENNPPSFYLSRHYEVCKYFTLNEHTSVPDVLLVSEVLWQSLSPEQQNWLQVAADESAVFQRGLWTAASEEALEAVAAAGVEIIYPDRAAFRETVAGLHDVADQDPVIGPVYRAIEAIKL